MPILAVQPDNSTLDNSPSKTVSLVQSVKESVKRKSRGKRESYTLYIPQNIEIEQLLEQHPIAGIPNVRDYLVYLLHLIHGVPAYKKDVSIENTDGYTILHSTYLQNRVKKYSLLMEWLKERGMLESNNQYVAGKTSMGYRFSVEYLAALKPVSITTNTLIKNICKKKNKDAILQTWNLPGYSSVNDFPECVSYSQLAAIQLSYLRKWFNDYLQVNIEAAKQYLQSKYEQDRKNRSERYAMHKFNCSMLVLENLAGKNYRFMVDETAGRLHTLLTSLRTALRAFLSYDGKKLVSADIRNSQPLLSLVFLNPELLERNNILSRIAIYNRNFVRDAGIPSFSSTMLVNFVTAHSGEPDMLKYRELVISGKIYEHFGELLRDKKLTEAMGAELRKMAKMELFTLFFSHNKGCAGNKGAKIFKQEFPHVYEIFRMIKKDHHNTLACVLQNLEAEILLHGACKAIADIDPEIPLFTIHDSIATTSEHIELVKQVLTEQIRQVIDLPPQIKIEVWDESLLQQHPEPLPEPQPQSQYKISHNLYGYADDEPLYSIGKVAKELGIGRNRLLSGLRHLGILGSNQLSDWNKPAQELVTGGYFKYSERYFRGKLCHSISVTETGKNLIAELLNNHSEVFST